MPLRWSVTLTLGFSELLQPWKPLERHPPSRRALADSCGRSRRPITCGGRSSAFPTGDNARPDANIKGPHNQRRTRAIP